MIKKLSTNLAFATVCVLLTGLTAQAQGTWTLTGPLNIGRINPTATLLTDGRVIVAAGRGGDAAFTSELYDPDSGTWNLSGELTGSHDWGKATPLSDGRVLLVGGLGSSVAEIYDPGTGTWSPTARMNIDRAFHTATLLPDGRVLVAGGATQEYAVGNAWSAELYDPSSGTWTFTAPMNVWRLEHTATLLNDGTVLVTGGRTRYGPEAITATAEIYDPATDTWTLTSDMTTSRHNHSATPLTDGRVLVAGGIHFEGGAFVYLASAELYDPTTGTWTQADNMNSARANHTATLLLDGTVLVAGGSNGVSALTSTEIFDPAAGTWAAGSEMNLPRWNHAATLLSDGTVLIAGGSPDDPTSTEIFIP